MDRIPKVLLLVVACVVLIPALAHAQAEIAGVVKDASGGVLPGVTVEAASPALIEKARGRRDRRVRSVPDYRTEARSVHADVHARRVSAVVKREGIQLAGSFAATIDVELRVGASRRRSPSPAQRRSSTCRTRRRRRCMTKSGARRHSRRPQPPHAGDPRAWPDGVAGRGARQPHGRGRNAKPAEHA